MPSEDYFVVFCLFGMSIQSGALDFLYQTLDFPLAARRDKHKRYLFCYNYPTVDNFSEQLIHFGLFSRLTEDVRLHN